MTMVTALSFIGNIKSQVSLYRGTLQTIRDLMNNCLDEEPPSDHPERKKWLLSLSDSVQFNDVNFNYSPSLHLSGIKLDIARGTYIVLCGESGSSKSTILHLLMRFCEPNEGSIEWDGTNIYDTSLESYRKQVGVVFNRTMIFQASVRDNILFGMPEREFGLVKAAKDADIHEDISALPYGYDTSKS